MCFASSSTSAASDPNSSRSTKPRLPWQDRAVRLRPFHDLINANYARDVAKNKVLTKSASAVVDNPDVTRRRQAGVGSLDSFRIPIQGRNR